MLGKRQAQIRFCIEDLIWGSSADLQNQRPSTFSACSCAVKPEEFADFELLAVVVATEPVGTWVGIFSLICGQTARSWRFLCRSG